MHILIVNNNTRYLDILQKLFLNHHTQIFNRELYRHDANRLKEFDAIVLSGGGPHTVARKHKLYQEEIHTIRHANVPIVGICLGFELIVYAFGGTLKELPQRVKGMYEIHVMRDDPMFAGTKTLQVFENHRWTVHKLPSVLEPLAQSATGVEITKHASRPIWGFQFHPEVDVPGQNNLLVELLRTISH